MYLNEFKTAVKDEHVNDAFLCVRPDTSQRSCDHGPAAAHNHCLDISEPIRFQIFTETARHNPHMNQLSLWSVIVKFFENGGTCVGVNTSSSLPTTTRLHFFLFPQEESDKNRLQLHSVNWQAGNSRINRPSSDPFQPPYNTAVHLHCASMVCTFNTQAADITKSWTVNMSVCEIDLTASSWFRSRLLPRREVGLWRCCFCFGEEREGVEYLGSWAAAGKQGHFSMGVRLHSAWDSPHNWRKKKGGRRGKGGHRILRCSLRPLGGPTAKHPQAASFRWRSSRLSEQSVNAMGSFNSQSHQSQRRQKDGGWFWLHMLCSEEKSAGEAEM